MFLGADQDSYGEGGKIGVSARNRADWDKSGRGTREMWEDASHSQGAYYRRSRAERANSKDEYWQKKQEAMRQAEEQVKSKP